VFDEQEVKADIHSDEDGDNGLDIIKERGDNVDSKVIVQEIIKDLVNEDISSHDEDDTMSSEEDSIDKHDDSLSSIEEKIEEKVVVKTLPVNNKMTNPLDNKVQQKSALDILMGCFGCFKPQKT
jgi:hypothetical protein